MHPVDLPATIEPMQWNLVFHRRALNRWLAWLTPGRFKHVAAFAYLPGVRLWLGYDVQWSGTRIVLMDKAAVMAWTRGCAVVEVAVTRQPMGASSRLGFYCVNAVKHLVGVKCIAATPDQLYRHILSHGGRLISEPGPAPADAGRPDARAGTAAGAAGHDQVAAGPNPV
jgi:hypothetical protein